MTFWVLGVLRPRGATWLGLVISSPPVPSGWVFMTHRMPGGGVPRDDGALSPDPRQLPHFATPWSVRHLATVVAGAYPLRRPLMPGCPGCRRRQAPATGLWPVGPPRAGAEGCLAAGLVCSTVCYYCLGGCSALVLCARLLRQFWRVGAGAGSRFSPWAPPCPRVPRGACCGLSCPGVPSPRLPVRHSMRSVRWAHSVWLPFGSAPRVRCLCVRSCSRGVRPHPRVGVARALRGFWCRAPVGLFQGVLAPPRFLPRSRALPI